jgi:chromosome segregation ATPase
MEGSCDRREAVCPFATIGCGVMCTQGELSEHLFSHGAQHLLFAVGQIGRQQQILDGSTAELLDVRNRAHAAEAECSRYRQEIGGLSKTISAMQKEQAALSKRMAASEQAVKKVDAAVTSTARQLGSSDKEAKSGLSKLAHEHGKLKTTVDALLRQTVSE